MNDFTNWFHQQFKRLESEWRDSIAELDESNLYSETQQQLSPAAEQILRSARIVEQVSGGITAKLWDDPFEWTLPETLRTKDKLFGYVDEVREARESAFQLIKDGDLLKTVMAPGGPTQLMSLLLDALVRAAYHNLQAKDHLKQQTRL